MATIQPIALIKFGSHLYGTDTPNSDLDIKGVYIPKARDIILQRIQPVISYSRRKAHGQKNTPGDIDYEFYSPQKFLDLLSEGHIAALDMLFAPTFAMLSPLKEEWLHMKALASKLLTKQSTSFVRYCRQQANKYGIKGSRVAAARVALEFLTDAENNYGSAAPLSAVADELQTLSTGNEFLSINEGAEIQGNLNGYFSICGKKALFNCSIKSARTIASHLVDEYGKRALSAHRNEGIDWKALSHAVRVGRQAIEFFTTHHITFPRPEAKHLLDIKQGRLSFQQVSEEIEQLFLDVEREAASSSLPDTFSKTVIESYIEKLYSTIILNELRK